MTESAVGNELDRFVAASYHRLLGLLILRVGNKAVAEELAQETLLKLVKNWDRVRVMDNPWAWLARVALNQSTSRWRRLATAERAHRRLDPIETVEPEDGLFELLLLIGGLPKRQRTALLLRHYAHLSVKETAAAMGCAEGTVKSLTNRAVERLRIELTELTEPTGLPEEVDHADD